VLTLLRKRLFIFSIIALSGCATAPPQQANNPAQPENKTVAAAQTETKPATIVVQPETISQAVEHAVVTIAPSTTEVASSTPVKPAATPPVTADNNVSNQIDVWQRIRKGFAMKPMESKNIARFENWYARQPEYVSRMTDRARRYLYFIVEEVEKRGMPMEIALLPMIESAFNPGAYSSARASGIWQFIPSTGKNFGMQQNWWYDGRRDVISATKGALDYLQKLHHQFGAWDLALAAYNAGENSVMRAQARNRKRKLPTNYASLKLPKETRQYVPKLLAVKHIVDNPGAYGLVLTDIPNKPYFSEVLTTRHIDVEIAATMAGISMDEFAALNPAHNRPVILQKGDEVLLLPVDAVDTFQANLRRTDQPLVSWQACPTKKGEDLEDIASRYGISTEKLRSVNGIHRSIKASNGQTLLVPLNGLQPETEFTAFNTHLPPTDNSLLNAIRHIVRKGDTLSGIARRYRVKLSSLKNWNRGVRILRPGQHILVAQPAHVQRASKSGRNIKNAKVIRKNTLPASTKS
jgi:membrane-bound lytic murein transglycosylase D